MNNLSNSVNKLTTTCFRYKNEKDNFPPAEWRSIHYSHFFYIIVTISLRIRSLGLRLNRIRLRDWGTAKIVTARGLSTSGQLY